MEGELIFLGFIMLIGQIILMEMWNRNWFKKENFKIQKSNLLATNKLQLRKLEKEMGLTPGKESKEKRGTFDTIKDLAPLLKNLDADQIGMLFDKFIGGGSGEEYEEENVEGMLMDYAVENPEVVKKFLAGLTEGKGGEESIAEEIVFEP